MRYAVSFIDWYNYELITEFHEANSPVEAMKKHSMFGQNNPTDMPNTVEAFKQFCFDCDSMCHAEPTP